jgi:amino-acid N-acetyltransferase
VRLVIVLGAQQQIDAQLRQQGREPRFVGGYRVTDPAALLAAVEASGCSRMEVRLSAEPVGGTPAISGPQ